MTLLAPSDLAAFAAAAVPLSLWIGAATIRAATPLADATRAAGVALAAAGVMVFLALRGPSSTSLPVRVDAVSLVLLPLVSALGLAVTRFSRSYLRGDPRQRPYARALLGALGAACGVALARDLVALALGWTALSLALHALLLHFEDRVAARVAAHKKFLLSRASDLLLWSAIALVYGALGTTDLDALARAAATPSAPLRLAAVLFAAAATVRCAQLPFHGWLTQVMEAPTPVSALLHAGVVNVGGVLLLRVAPLINHAPEARAWLLVVGLSTAVLAALVSTTRVSVKVALAWSTCAQMGIMLAQCGLGAWQLALLHLAAHSLYKADAFLRTGSAVRRWRLLAQRTPDAPALHPALALVPGLLAAALAVGALHAAGMLHADHAPTLIPQSLLVALALASAQPRRLAPTPAGVGTAGLFLGWHLVADRVGASLPAAPDTAGWWLVVAAFTAVFVVDAVTRRNPEGALARALHPALFAGLYLDERLTRLTFRLWPPRLPPVERPLRTLTQSLES
jgi:NAD(P)H-quinone oxidoreductase subunit 5